jgi:hypothetical protein
MYVSKIPEIAFTVVIALLNTAASYVFFMSTDWLFLVISLATTIVLGFRIKDDVIHHRSGMVYRTVQVRVHELIDTVMALDPSAPVLTCRWNGRMYHIFSRELPYPFSPSPFSKMYRTVVEAELMDPIGDESQDICIIREMTFCEPGIIFYHAEVFDAETMDQLADDRPQHTSFRKFKQRLITPELLFVSLDELRRIESLLSEIPANEWADET